ncbi:MAG TPA: hypothetical protein VGO58_12770 [Chitinophagaceae bacterium]|jgi:tetratricopeptide (TPR) repeat protein|nr:hypothetical protein [Chitinophagaceae bacterium]
MKLKIFLIRSLAFSLLLGSVLISCKEQEQKPVTPDEAKEFAKKLESSIEKRNPDFMNEAMDKKTFMKKAGLGSGKDARAFGSGIDEGMKMGTTITRSISKKATYQLVKHYEKDNVQHVLFRMYDDGSLNYHDIELTRAGKDIKIADIFVYTTGEFLSETIRGLYNQVKTAMDKNSIKNSQDEWSTKLPQMRALMTAGKYQEALDVYEDLPADIKRMRAVQIVHVLISSGLNDFTKYSAAIEEYKKLYPNEPNMHLLLLDGYIINKEYDKALDGVNQIDKMIDKDPFLDYYRYLVYNLKEKGDSAKISLERLMKNIPDFEDGMLEIIALYIEEDNKTGAGQWIEKFKLSSSYDQERLEQLLTATGYKPA